MDGYIALVLRQPGGGYRAVFWSLAGALVLVGAVVAASGRREARVAEAAGRA